MQGVDYFGVSMCDAKDFCVEKSHDDYWNIEDHAQNSCDVISVDLYVIIKRNCNKNLLRNESMKKA